MKNQRIILVLLITLILLFAVVDSSLADEIKVIIDGWEVNFDRYGQGPVIQNGRTMVPLRAVADMLGATVDWDQQAQRVSLKKGGQDVVVNVGEGVASKDGVDVKLDTPAAVINGRVLVPLRFVGEALGVNVSWTGTPRAVVIDTLAENKGLELEWERTFAGGKNGRPRNIIQTRDGEFVIVGGAYTGNSYDVELTKLDSAGNKIWAKTFGREYADNGNWVEETKDGGFVVAGYAQLSDPDVSEAYLAKTDSTGKVQWDLLLGESFGSYLYIARMVRETSAGEYIVVGERDAPGAVKINTFTNRHLFLAMVDGFGNKKWEHVFGRPDYSYFASGLLETKDGGFAILARRINRDKFKDIFSVENIIIKTDRSGNMVWEKNVNPGRGYTIYNGKAFKQLPDGGFLIAGETGYFNTAAIVMRTDAGINVMWKKIYTGNLQINNAIMAVDKPNGEYVFFIKSASNSLEFRDVSVFTTDAQGNIRSVNKKEEIWLARGDDQEINAVAPTADGGFVAVGYRKNPDGGAGSYYVARIKPVR